VTVLRLPVIEAEAADQKVASEVATLPPELATLVATLQRRMARDDLRAGIVRLCTWRPLSGEELAELLHRDRHYLRNKHLIPMVASGVLALRYPGQPNHPQQAYVVA
jgi:ATP-dependent DNA helicase RecG